MTENHEFFSPEQIDEQIDRLAQPGTPTRKTRPSARPGFQKEAGLVADLRGYYQAVKQEDITSLERAWKRVSPHLAGSGERSQPLEKPFLHERFRASSERTHPMYAQTPERPKRQRAHRWLGMLAAVLVAVVLVAGLITVLNLSNHTKTVANPKMGIAVSQPTATPTLQPIGTTVYTSPASQATDIHFYWSPDSKRVASLGDSNGLHIWDATTGGDSVIFTPSGSNEWITEVAWSPVSQEIAVGTNLHLLLVNGQTGAIDHTYSIGATTLGAFRSPYLSSLRPASGGTGLRALSWSPDGTKLAVGLSYGASGSLQIWSMPSGKVMATFTLGDSYVISSTAWSSDGKYVAAHGFDTQADDPTIPNDIVAVWNASSQQEIFKKTVALDGSDAPLYWQPRTYNLVFSSFSSMSNAAFSLVIWDVLSGKEVHQYKNRGSDNLAFSPDGQQIAYDSFVGKGDTGHRVIVIMDAKSGTPTYVYKQGGGTLAWSPNGQYIVSALDGTLVLDKQNHPIIKNGLPETTPSYIKVWIA